MDNQKTAYGKIDNSRPLSPVESLALAMFKEHQTALDVLDIACCLAGGLIYPSAMLGHYKRVAFDSLERLVARGVLVRAGMPSGHGRPGINSQMPLLTYSLSSAYAAARTL